ncbi:exported hypothetical protein [Gammaproteobacteria bacterium]
MRTIIALLLMASLAYAGEMTVVTGYGYYVKDGQITDKAELPKGKHQLTDGYTYVEVANQEELDAVEVYQPKAEDTVASIRQEALDKIIQEKIESDIDLKIRAEAIDGKQRIK